MELTQIMIELETSLLVAEQRHDWSAIERLLDPEFYEVGVDGGVHSAAALASAFQFVRLDTYQLSEFRVTQLSPEVALVTCKADVQFTYGGQAGPRLFRMSSVWTRRTGEWKLRFHQVTAIAAR